MNIHSVIIKCNKYGLIVILDKDLPFEELLKDIEDKFKESAKFFKNAKMAMTIRGRVLSQSEAGGGDHRQQLWTPYPLCYRRRSERGNAFSSGSG